MSSKNKKIALNNNQRQQIVAYKKHNPSVSNVDLVKWVKETFDIDIHPSTICHLMKQKENIAGNPSAKRQRTVQYPEIENALYEWILRSQDKIILTDAILTEKAKNFAQLLNIPSDNFKFSCGWLEFFWNRDGN